MAGEEGGYCTPPLKIDLFVPRETIQAPAEWPLLFQRIKPVQQFLSSSQALALKQCEWR